MIQQNTTMVKLACGLGSRANLRAVAKALIEGGGVYSYIGVMPDLFLLKLTLITTDFKRSGHNTNI